MESIFVICWLLVAAVSHNVWGNTAVVFGAMNDQFPRAKNNGAVALRKTHSATLRQCYPCYTQARSTDLILRRKGEKMDTIAWLVIALVVGICIVITLNNLGGGDRFGN
jgi:hypothetical protein